MKLIPKRFLGFWAILILAAIFSINFFTKDSNKSQVTITGAENKFLVNFDLISSDKNSLLQILDDFQIPQSSIEDLSFELDSTSSAQLIYLSPIQINPTITKKVISFTGNTSRRLFVNNSSAEKIKIPANFNLAVFAPNLLSFVASKNLYPAELVDWMNNNFSIDEGQYLVVFGPNAEFSIISKNKDADLSTLKNLKLTESIEASYKEEVRDDIPFHFISITKNVEKVETAAFFKREDLIVYSSSREAAFAMADAFSSKNSSDFPAFNFEKDSNFIFSLNNKEEAEINENMLSLISSFDTQLSIPNQQKFLERIEEINFALKANSFSGLISLK